MGTIFTVFSPLHLPNHSFPVCSQIHDFLFLRSLLIYVCMCMYIYTHTYVYTYPPESVYHCLCVLGLITWSHQGACPGENRSALSRDHLLLVAVRSGPGDIALMHADMGGFD